MCCYRLLVVWGLLIVGGAWAAEEAPPVVREITAEVTKKTSDPGGRPLPVVGHWANSFGRDNFSSDFQVAKLAEGHHLVPTLPMPRVGAEAYLREPKPKPGRQQAGPSQADLQYQVAVDTVRQVAAWKAPITLRAGQWEQWLLSKDHPVDAPGKWRNLPKDQTPLLINLNGEVENWLSPFGAVAPWREVGKYYTRSGAFAQLQELYPDPPLVIFLSNNEARKIKTKHKVETRSKRYVDKYGTGTSGNQQRQALGDGYLERYAALLKGMEEGLTAAAWKRNRLFVAYGAFGPSHLGRWDGWTDYSLHTEDRIDPWHLVWDGSSPSYYTHDWDASTDYRVWSPQIEAMNWVFMLDEAYRDRPDFWFELSLWDGNAGASASEEKQKGEKRRKYLQAGQEWSADRYGGFVQFGMWLTTPRVMREFRGSTVKRADFVEEFDALLAAVDRVWENPTLTRFWRQGQLVPNRTRQHPYQSRIPEQWKAADRWFLLNTSLDPEGEWKTSTEIPVFSLARVLGDKPNREWLLYAHAPVEARNEVEIEIPEFGKVTVDVAVGGSFYTVREGEGAATPVARDTEE